MWSSASEQVLSAHYHCSQQAESPGVTEVAFLKRLRHGVLFYDKTRPNSTVLDLPAALQSGAFYIPAAENASQLEVHIHVPAKAYILVPALQELPSCFSEFFELVKGAEVKVRWSGFSLKQRAYLNITNQRQTYTEQPLLLYKYIGRAGLLLRDEVLQLPLQRDSPAKSTPAAGLYFQPIFCLRPARAHGALNSSWSGDGSGLRNADFAVCSMQLIYSSIEQGAFEASKLDQHQANVVLQRVMAAEDDELLIMLVEAGVVTRCSLPCLEQLLDYVQKHVLPYLAEMLLQKTTVELTQTLLEWLVEVLIASNSLAEVEQLLSSYIMGRRNPLSAIAAVEYALCKAATSNLVEDADAMQLAMRFRTAKHALLQQLTQQYAEQHQAACTSTVLNGSMLNGTASVNAQQAGSLPQILDPLLQTVTLCLQEQPLPLLGRGDVSSGRISIHDCSPYKLSLELRDATFFSLPAVMDYTRLMWEGRELYCMRTTILQQQLAAEAMSPALSPASKVSSDIALVRGAENTGIASGRCPAAPTATDSVPEHLQHRSSSEACLGGHHDGSGSCRTSKLRVTQQSVGSASCTSAMLANHTASAGTAALGSLGYIGSQASATTWSSESEVESPWMEPTVLYDMMLNLGIASRHIGSSLASLGCRKMYGILVAPRAITHSPRGWWMMHLVPEMFILYCYMVVILANQRGPLSGLIPILIGNLVNISFQLRHKYGSSVSLYLQDHWNKLDVFMTVGLLGAIHEIIPRSPHQLLPKEFLQRLERVEAHGVPASRLAASALAVLVWSRALMVLIPFSSKLGAMLCTLRQAADEAAVMVPVLAVLLVGFGTTLTVVYSSSIGKYDSLIGAIRTLIGITGSDLRLSDFETEAAMSNRFLLVYGQVVVIVYIVLVNILIMTLLIAMINHTYQPEVVKSQAVVMQAESVSRYDWHVRCGVSHTPFNFFQLLFCWLPRGFRSRAAPSACLKWGIPPFDGYVPESIAGATAMLLATGPAEIAYLGFLLVTYPMLAIIGIISLIMHVPFGVAHFVAEGHKLWWDNPWDASANLCSANEQGKSGGPSCTYYACCATDPPIGKLESLEAEKQKKPSIAADRRQQNLLATSCMTHMLNSGHAEVFVGRLQEHPGNHLRQNGSLSQRAEQQTMLLLDRRGLSYIAQQLFKVVSVPLAAFVGLLAHMVLLAALMFWILWAWVTRVLYSLYCICFSAAANSNCCMKLSRSANFWSEECVYSAFEAAGITVMSLQSYRSVEADLRCAASMVSQSIGRTTTSSAVCAGGMSLKSTSCNPTDKQDTVSHPQVSTAQAEWAAELLASTSSSKRRDSAAALSFDNPCYSPSSIDGASGSLSRRSAEANKVTTIYQAQRNAEAQLAQGRQQA